MPPLHLPLKAIQKFQTNSDLMAKQHKKTYAEISRSTYSDQHGQYQHIVAQQQLHEGNWRVPSFG